MLSEQNTPTTLACMEDCPGCTTVLPDDAAFCPTCGLPVVKQSDAVDLFLSPGKSSPRAEPDVEAATSTSLATRHRSVSSRGLIAAAAMAGLVLAVGAWTAQGQSTPEASAGTSSPSTDEMEPVGPTGQAIAPGNNEPNTASDTDNSPEATDFFDGEFSSDVFVNLSLVGPLLENEDVGYRLLASSDGQLFDIDLDTGELTRHPIDIDPVGLLGAELVAFDPERGFVALPVDNLATTGRMIFAVPEVEATDRAVSVRNLVGAAVREPNTLLVDFLRPDEGTGRLGTQLYEIDIGTGRFAATSLAVDPRPQTPHRARYGLAALDGGGLFEAGGNSYRKLADGEALLLGVNYVVARSCPEPGACLTQWFERSSGQQVERALPTAAEIVGPSNRQGAGTDRPLLSIDEVDGDATVVIITGPGTSGSAYYDVENGRRLTALDPLSLDFTPGPMGRPFAALSPDGRWMALPVGGSIVLFDRIEELLYRRGFGPTATMEQFIFVPNGR